MDLEAVVQLDCSAELGRWFYPDRDCWSALAAVASSSVVSVEWLIKWPCFLDGRHGRLGAPLAAKDVHLLDRSAVECEDIVEEAPV